MSIKDTVYGITGQFMEVFEKPYDDAIEELMDKINSAKESQTPNVSDLVNRCINQAFVDMDEIMLELVSVDGELRLSVHVTLGGVESTENGSEHQISHVIDPTYYSRLDMANVQDYCEPEQVSSLSSLSKSLKKFAKEIDESVAKCIN